MRLMWDRCTHDHRFLLHYMNWAPMTDPPADARLQTGWTLWGNVFIIIVLYLEPVMQLLCVARSPGSCHSLSFSLLVSITHNQSHTYYRRQWLCIYRLCGDFPHDGCNTACRCHFVPTQTGFLCTLSHFSIPCSQCNNVLS